MRRLGEERIKVDDVGLRRPTLDDVFLALTGHAAEEPEPDEDEEVAALTAVGIVNDGLVMTWRNLKRVPRIPGSRSSRSLQSIMFVLLFAYVFGGAIPSRTAAPTAST